MGHVKPPASGELSSGADMMRLAEALFPICRSITGNGTRESLRMIAWYIPLELKEVASGTSVLDWTVPKEWNIRGAYIARLDGTRVVDFAENNLHIVQYSVPLDTVMPLAELRRHLHVSDAHPSWIPYRTSYYKEIWGFCLAQRQLDALTDERYRVVIDTALEPGHLTYGECVIPASATTRCCSPAISAIRRSPMTTSRESPWRWRWRAPCSRRLDAIPIGSCTYPARSALSPGFLAMRPRWRGSATASCSPVSATPAE
jgi:aminopeptidase-like protein